MATVYWPFDPFQATMRSTAFPAHVQANGSNYPFRALAFDASTDEAAFFTFPATRYGSGNVTVDVWWYADTASSGAVVWGAQIAAITGDSDSQDVETDSLATAATVTDTHLGTTGQRLHKTAITVSSLDSLSADDWVTLRFYRDADAGGDTMTGDALLAGIIVSYSDA